MLIRSQGTATLLTATARRIRLCKKHTAMISDLAARERQACAGIPGALTKPPSQLIRTSMRPSNFIFDARHPNDPQGPNDVGHDLQDFTSKKKASAVMSRFIGKTEDRKNQARIIQIGSSFAAWMRATTVWLEVFEHLSDSARVITVSCREWEKIAQVANYPGMTQTSNAKKNGKERKGKTNRNLALSWKTLYFHIFSEPDRKSLLPEES